MDVVISSGLLARISAHAAEDPRREVCGLLLGGHNAIRDIRPAANVAPDPAIAFEVDPAILFAAHRTARNGGPAVLGCYHSHPSGSCAPSERDAAAAIAGQLWLIATAEKVALFRAEPGGGFSEQAIRHA